MFTLLYIYDGNPINILILEMIKLITFENLVKGSKILTQTLKHILKKKYVSDLLVKTRVYRFGKEAESSLGSGHFDFQNGELLKGFDTVIVKMLHLL